MSRFLFVVPPLVGHINPAVALAAELGARGHEVAWAGHGGLIRQLAGPDTTVFSCAVPENLAERPADLKGPAAFQFLWERFLIPLADAMAAGVRDAIVAFEPDIVVADQQAIAGGLIADELGLTWVTSATTSTRELFGDAELPHERVWLIGPSISTRPSSSDFPWDWLDPGTPAVLVSLGTANVDAGARFLATAVDALSGLAGKVQAIVVDPSSSLGVPPDHILVRRQVPQLDLLKYLDAVVCHAGHNTVCESLWHGVPLVVAPIRDDQPIVAGQVVDAGAGLRVRFGRLTPEMLERAIQAILAEDGRYRLEAERIGRSFQAAGGTHTGADHLEKLLI